MKKLKPHKEYDFVNHDKVFYETTTGPQYCELYYEQETAAWMLVPYTDKHFTEPKKNEEGKVHADFLYEVGYEGLERVEDYDLEELD